MTAKIVTFVIIALLNGAAGFLLLLTLVLGLNGFSEHDAQWSIYLFVAGAIIVAVATGVAGIFFTKYLIETKNINAVLSVIGSSITFFAVGIVIDVVLMFSGVFLASIIRNSHLK